MRRRPLVLAIGDAEIISVIVALFFNSASKRSPMFFLSSSKSRVESEA